MSGAQIGLGLAALGRPAYINIGHGDDVADTSVEAMERLAHEVLDAAYDRGVRWFDAARSYGRAEAFLASWLERREIRPGDVTVSSKWGYRYTAGWRADATEHEVKDLSAEHLRAQWPETRELLGDWLSLYQIHSATLDSGVLDDSAVRAELDELHRRGIRSASPSPVTTKRTPSNAPWPRAASTPCRPPGTSTSARPSTRSPGPTTPAWRCS